MLLFILSFNHDRLLPGSVPGSVRGLEMWGFARRTRPPSLLRDGIFIAGVMTEKCFRWWKVRGREFKPADVQPLPLLQME